MHGDQKLIKQCLTEVEGLDGDLAEVGVWRGDSAVWILDCTGYGTLHLFDTFAGMPASMTIDADYHRPGGWSDTSVTLVETKLSEHAGRYEIHAGVFPQTAGEPRKYRFVHIDVDQYLSTKAALEFFAPLLVEGGVILLDDYGCGSTPGAKRATDEFVKATGGEYVFEVCGARGILKPALTEATYGHD